MAYLEIDPPDDFRLHSSIEFLSGFAPQPVGAGNGPGSADAIAWNLRRILSLDVDATGFDQVVAGDSVLAETIDLEAGIRPTLFWSPYEAAVWAVLSQRVRMTQATALKSRLASHYGANSTGEPATPPPEQLLAVQSLDGVTDTKLDRLHAVAQAALDGTLDPERLRELPTDEALQELESINGIGPFTAELILVRGAGAPDVFPSRETRLHAIMRDRYDLPEATLDDLALIADGWKPFRSWISFHLRASHH